MIFTMMHGSTNIKSVDQIQFCLKYGKNNRHFRQKKMEIYDTNSLIQK